MKRFVHRARTLTLLEWLGLLLISPVALVVFVFCGVIAAMVGFCSIAESALDKLFGNDTKSAS